MNSPDPWRSIIGAHHGGGGGGHHGGGHGGGHHHHGGGGRRRYFNSGGGWGYPYWYPYGYEDPTVLVDNRTFYNGEEVDPAVGPYGPAYIQGALAEPPRPRDGLLAQVAPVLAPATGGIQAAFNLDGQHRLFAVVTVDGQTYQGSIDLAPVVQAIMMQLRHTPGAARVAGILDTLNEPCGAKLFYGVTENKMLMIIKRLQAEGASFTGNNPWNVSLKNSGFTIKMRGSWNPTANTLHLEVLEAPPGMCDRTWGELNKHLSGVGVSSTPLPPPPPSRAPQSAPPPSQQVPQQSAPQAPAPQQNGFEVPTAQEVVAAIDRAVAEARNSMVKSLVGQHISTVSSGWFDKLKHAAGSAVRGVGKVAHSKAIVATLKKYKGPIASAAGLAAGSAAGLIGGPAAGLVANKLANSLTHAAAGDGSAKKALEEARSDAMRDPKLANALGHAEKAVAATTAAYHVAETARAATSGNQDAAAEMNKLADAAQQGDKAAQVALQLAQTATSATDGTPAAQVSGDYEIMMREVAKKAMRNAHRQRGGKFAGETGFVMPSGQTLGYVRTGNDQQVYFFPNLRDAMAWFQKNASPSADYVTLVDRGQLETAGPRGAIAFLIERFGSNPVSSVASVSGDEYVVPRVPVLDEDGNLTRLQAAWNASQPVPAYFVESSHGDMWLFEDPAGDIYFDPSAMSPYAPRGMAGKRYRSKDALVKPPIFGDRTQPGVPMAPSDPSTPPPVVGAQRPWQQSKALIQSAIQDVMDHQPGARLDPNLHVVGGTRTKQANLYVWSLEAPPENMRGNITFDPMTFLVPFDTMDQALAHLREASQARPLAIALFDRSSSHWPNPIRWSTGTDPGVDGMIAQYLGSRGGAPVVGTGGPRVEIIGAANEALAALRKQASDAAQQGEARVIGLVKWANGNWDVQTFKSSDDADDWLGQTTNQPELYVYAAYFDKSDATFPNPMNESVGHAVRMSRPRKPQAHEAIPRGVATVY